MGLVFIVTVLNYPLSIDAHTHHDYEYQTHSSYLHLYGSVRRFAWREHRPSRVRADGRPQCTEGAHHRCGDLSRSEDVSGGAAAIKALNDRGIQVSDYFLSKAQCWLDVSFHEYTRNDRSAFPQAALSESEKIVRALETNTTPNPGEQTPLVNNAAKLRDDLWMRLNALKRHAGSACAAQ